MWLKNIRDTCYQEVSYNTGIRGFPGLPGPKGSMGLMGPPGSSGKKGDHGERVSISIGNLKSDIIWL